MSNPSIIRTPFPSTKEVADALGATPSDVRRVERLLKAAGYIEGKRKTASARAAQSQSHARRKKKRKA